ncbi:MAG TPA: recombinase [Candidatus Marinimicrobia bacterium]|nr:recombinase [Candidatus Neomarinimicrobiota bacterium]
MDYEQYEKECKRIRKENKKLISNFEKWLSNKNLSSKTNKKHASNVDFYVNDFLLYEDAVEAKNGASKVGMFLGYWFIKKAMWANKTAIKENAASLKKFYQFLYEQCKISEEDFSDLKESIKEEMPEWLATMDRYDDPDIDDMEEVWGL